VERSALRANLVQWARDWPWCSLNRRASRPNWLPLILLPLADWPSPVPSNWTAYVNRPQSEKELDALRRSVNRGAPYGDETWTEQTAIRLGLESSLRDPWRPKLSGGAEAETAQNAGRGNKGT
jgi:putative transposase